MKTSTENDRQAVQRRVTRFLSVLVLMAALYTGGVFYARWDRDRRMEQLQRQREVQEARRSFELMGGDRFEILQFYASPGVIRRGESVLLCYGVSNALTVRLEPYPEPLRPSLSHCVRVAPAEDTTYTLTIQDDKGNTKSESVTVRVLPE